MNRREALKRIALLSGGALSLSTVSGILGGCRAGGGAYSTQTLTSDQYDLVARIADLIIPPTDTPGAKAAGVQEYVDHMLTDWNTEEEKNHFLDGLDHVDEVSRDSFDSGFMELEESQQVEILKQLENEAKEDNSDSDLDPFFRMMKEFTIVGYYTSEIGADQELQAGIVPGYYDACAPYSEIGKAWSI